MKKIEVCEFCSGLDIKELKRDYKIKVGCIGKCNKKNPELNGKVYGFLNGIFTICDTPREFISKIEELDEYIPFDNHNPLVDAFLSNTDKWHGEFIELREIVLACGLIEELKWGQPCYMFGKENVIILGGFKEYIAINFFKGTLIEDSKSILVQQTENIQAARQIRFKNVDEIKQLEDTIKEYIQQAIDIEKQGLVVPLKKQVELEIPEELIAKFETDPKLKIAFQNLTPGRQRGYLYFFSQAKQSKTKTARIEKFIPKILQGKGMDD